MARGPVRTMEERIESIDLRIAFHLENIEKLEAQKKKLLSPKKRAKKPTFKTILTVARESGMTPEEIAQKLNLPI